MDEQLYDSRYRQKTSYWGPEPTTIAKQFVNKGLPILQKTFSGEAIHIADMGCGDGRDAKHYALHGVHVTAMDISGPGIEALNFKAQGLGLTGLITTHVADIVDFRLDAPCHAIVSSGALHYIPPEKRGEVLSHYKEQVRPGGIIAATVILKKPFIDPAPDEDPSVTLFQSGEILQYLWDWEVLWVVEQIRPCNSSGVPHRHAFDRVIAKKPK